MKPSHAHQWVYCPGSVGLQKKYPDNRDNTGRLDGLSAHRLAEQMLTGAPPTPHNLPDEYVRAVGVYVDHVRSIVGERHLYVEYPLTVDLVHHQCRARLDAAWYDSAVDHLHIWDAKFGYGIVEPYENWQLILDAIGLSAQIRYGTVSLHIAQPLAFHPGGPIRTWTTTEDRIKSYVPMLRKAALATLEDNPPTLTGSHCKNCSALSYCPSAVLAVGFAVDVAGESTPITQTPEMIGHRLAILSRAEEMISHARKAMESTALSLFKNGTVVPGWQVGSTPGRLNWLPGKEVEIKTMAALMGVTVTKAEMITPTQTINAGVPAEVVEMYAKRSAGALKLERVNIHKPTVIGGMFNAQITR